MAEIYRAKHICEGGFEKTVAIKKLLPNWSEDQNFITMLIDEAKALVHLQHPNIVQVIELGKDENCYFLSMELVDGIDLGKFFKRINKEGIDLPLKFIIYIISKILQALGFAHQQRGADGRFLDIVHRDISPPNVLLSWNGEIKVADFGIAKGTHRTYQTAIAQAKGKFSYMSPEQARGEVVDKRTDIYAVGILFYELLSKKRLFDAPSDLEVIELVKRASISLDLLNNIDDELKEIIKRALQRDKNKRYQSADDFLGDLSQFTQKHSLLTTGFEFGRYLKENFPQEFEKGEKEINTTEEIYKKTKAFEKTPPKNFHPKKKIKYLALGTAGLSIVALFLFFTQKPLVPPAAKTTAIETTPKINTPATNTIAKDEFALVNVQARPWGYATIPGYIKDEETPIKDLKVKPGPLLVKVFYEPENQWVEESIEAKKNAKIRCIATFGDKKEMKCE